MPVVLIAVASPVPTSKLANEVPLPTRPPKVTAPLPFAMLNPRGPFNVPLKVIPPLLDVRVVVLPAPKVTALLYVCAPLVVTPVVLIAVVPVVVNEVSPDTVLLNVVAPAPDVVVAKENHPPP